MFFSAQDDQSIIRRKPRTFYGRRMERMRKMAMKKLQDMADGEEESSSEESDEDDDDE